MMEAKTSKVDDASWRRLLIIYSNLAFAGDESIYINEIINNINIICAPDREVMAVNILNDWFFNFNFILIIVSEKSLLDPVIAFVESDRDFHVRLQNHYSPFSFVAFFLSLLIFYDLWYIQLIVLLNFPLKEWKN